MLNNFRSTEQRSSAALPARKSSPSVRLPSVPSAPAPVSTYFTYKRILDLLLGAVLALLLMPIVAFVAALIMLTSFGPAFYTQVRLGRFGKPFVIWKLRSMAHRCEDKSGPQWSSSGDSRVTPLGRILRRLHIDEFPQLLNVFRGDMSLVGPRPERPEFFPILSTEVPNYADRLTVKPGVTGLAQVYLPPDEDVDGVKLKQRYDLYYIRHVGLSLDLRIIVATALQAIGLPHVVVRPMLFLPCAEIVEGTHVETPYREQRCAQRLTTEVRPTTIAS